MSTARVRLDRALVDRGLVASRSAAQAAVAAGLVVVAGAPSRNPARQVSANEAITVTGPPRRFVSRGGEKLDGALEFFEVDCADAVVLDAGASTGGFTDCVLQRGAALVYAVDVGYGQFDLGLRRDPRVVVRERANVRNLMPADLDEPNRACTGVDLVVADLSFISLTLVAEAFARLLRPEGRFVVLVKPQFEVERAVASAGRGVIRNPVHWRSAIDRVVGRFGEVGLVADRVVVSSLRGPKGNVEFLLHGRVGPGPSTLGTADLDRIVAEVDGESGGEDPCDV